jgi:RimJ/RimL family protein N-acetyltransferase
MMPIRPAVAADAAPLLELKQRLDRETSFMMYEAGEREASAEDLAADLGRVAQSANSVVLVADAGDHLAGYVELAGGSFRRSRATAYLVMGVRADAGGAGVGAALLRHAMQWAAGHGLHRLELTVMAHNHRAISLYERMGFSREGRRRQCLIVDGQFVDELTMAAILTRPPPGDKLGEHGNAC